MGIFDRIRAVKNNHSKSEKNKNKPGLIGLDIDNRHLHLCQLKPLDNNKYSITAKITVPFSQTRQELLESPQIFKRLISKAFKKKNFVGKKVTVVIPQDKVKIMLLTYQANVNDIDAEIIRLLSQRIEGDISDYVVDYLPVRNNESEEEHIVMASIIKRSEVDKFLSLLNYAGLEVCSLDIEPAALRRLISVLHTDERTSNILLINTSEDVSFLTIVSGRRLLFDQEVNFGYQQILNKISSTLDLSPLKVNELVYNHGFAHSTSTQNKSDNSLNSDVSETLLNIVKPSFIKLVEEIHRVLVFTASETHGIPLSRVYLVGCIARLPGAQDLIMSMLDISMPEHSIDFYDIFIDENELTVPWSNRLPELAVATGLALRDVTPND